MCLGFESKYTVHTLITFDDSLFTFAGNEWKSRFENQQEHNNTTGLQILQLTDTIENIRSQIASKETSNIEI